MLNCPFDHSLLQVSTPSVCGYASRVCWLQVAVIGWQWSDSTWCITWAMFIGVQPLQCCFARKSRSAARPGYPATPQVSCYCGWF